MINLDELLGMGILPDSLIRFGIRRLLCDTLAPFARMNAEQRQARLMDHIEGLRASPLAVATKEANEQHYELPTRFFQHVLGRRMKYSSGYWDASTPDLDAAEERMLAITAERAELADGQRILELGCGWGSLTLWMAEHFPNARITAISNSNSQREHIEAQLQQRGLHNVQVRTINMLDYQGEGSGVFDRVVSVEMFEHMQNYALLLGRIASWLKPDGRLFVHIFTHREVAYHFQTEGQDNWMGRYFFTGGQMPSDDLLLYFQDDLRIEAHWQVDGTHYQKTAEAWLKRMDAAYPAIHPILSETYGPAQAKRWWHYWRIFFMSCAELWGFRGGSEWIVSHYRFRKPA